MVAFELREQYPNKCPVTNENLYWLIYNMAPLVYKWFCPCKKSLSIIILSWFSSLLLSLFPFKISSHLTIFSIWIFLLLLGLFLSYIVFLLFLGFISLKRLVLLFLFCFSESVFSCFSVKTGINCKLLTWHILFKGSYTFTPKIA